MADFALCRDDLCPARFRCRRHRASGPRPTLGWDRHTYADFRHDPLIGACADLWPLRGAGKEAAKIPRSSDEASS